MVASAHLLLVVETTELISGGFAKVRGVYLNEETKYLFIIIIMLISIIRDDHKKRR